MKVLHICAHLGGGAGKAIIELSEICISLNKDWTVDVALCELPEQGKWIGHAKRHGMNIWICPGKERLINIVKGYDVIVFDWWAHPKMYEVLKQMEGTEIRSIVWTHCAGVVYPQFSASFIDKFDYWCPTCAYSYENPNWLEEDLQKLKSKSSIVYGMGNFQPEKLPYKKDYGTEGKIKVIYVGTVEFSKLHRDYFQACRSIVERCTNVAFYIYGEPSLEIVEEINRLGLKDYVHLQGYTENVAEVLEKGDIFGYPLNPAVSGTTENVLLEAMAAGLPIVVLNQGTEKHIIENGRTGLCVADMDAYVEAVAGLCTDWGKRRELGTNARDAVIATYHSFDNAKDFMSIIEKVCDSRKRKFVISDVIGVRPFDYFKQSLGNVDLINRDVLINDVVFQNGSKGSLMHFMRVYPNDPELSALCLNIEKRWGG